MGRLAETIPEMLTNTKFAHNLEYRLIAVMQETLSAQASGPDTAARRHHQLIIRRFREVLEAQADAPLHIPEISQKIGFSSRTLRSACQHQLGVSPGQYVMLRRLQAARRSLQRADGDVISVTNIATEHGLWELGRFAMKYRQVFGESPSATLKGSA